MRSAIIAILSFALGVAVGTRRRVHQSDLFSKIDTLLVGSPSKCADIYKGYPLSPVYRIDELQPGKHPIPGLEHITVHGHRQHGMHGFEVWLETFAPGSGTPIHAHNCHEVFVVLQGEAAVFIRDKSGKVVEASAPTNGTFALLPDARHQVRNPGQEDLQVLVVIDNSPFKPVIFES